MGPKTIPEVKSFRLLPFYDQETYAVRIKPYLEGLYQTVNI
jgi:hypothetical protein